MINIYSFHYKKKRNAPKKLPKGALFFNIHWRGKAYHVMKDLERQVPELKYYKFGFYTETELFRFLIKSLWFYKGYREAFKGV